MRKLAKAVRVVVVDPDANLIPAMRAGAFGLSHGRNLILYPEGERSIDGTPRTFKKGAAILSVHMQVPIVPIAIEGFHDAWPRGKSFQKFAPLKMTIGDPIYPPPESQASEANVRSTHRQGERSRGRNVEGTARRRTGGLGRSEGS